MLLITNTGISNAICFLFLRNKWTMNYLIPMDIKFVISLIGAWESNTIYKNITCSSFTSKHFSEFSKDLKEKCLWDSRLGVSDVKSLFWFRFNLLMAPIRLILTVKLSSNCCIYHLNIIIVKNLMRIMEKFDESDRFHWPQQSTFLYKLCIHF